MKQEKNDIFSKIIRGDVKCNKIYESECSVAFHDIAPRAKIHTLIIPKKFFLSFDDFVRNASNDDLCGFWRDVKEVVDVLELNDGYQIISNIGKDGGQEIPYFHVHIMSGERK